MTNKHQQQPEWKCDICAKDGIDTTFKAPTALGMHKRQKHGILGTSQASIQYREAKAKEAKATDASSPYKMTDEQRAKAREYAANRRLRLQEQKATYQSRSGSNKGSAQISIIKNEISKGAASNGEALALITTGKIIALCQAEAQKYDISAIAFTKRCAELFHASTLWE